MQEHRFSMQRTPMFKLVLIGESGVGKTSLFMRIKEDIFSAEATVGIESCSTAIELEGARIKFVIWDTAGVERFRTLTRNYYRNTHCVLLTCSLDDKASLDSLGRWNKDVDFYCKDCLKVIVASKNDLTPVVTQEQLHNFAATFGCKLISAVSAKTGSGVSEMLAAIGRQLLNSYTLSSLSHPHGSNIGGTQTVRQQQTQQQRATIDLGGGDTNSSWKNRFCCGAV